MLYTLCDKSLTALLRGEIQLICALLISAKLSIKRNIPLTLLDLLENWLKNCFSRIKRGNTFSHIFAIKFGVIGVSPLLFAIYLDDIPIARSLVPISFIVLYADILLIAPSVHELQWLFKNCKRELQWLDMWSSEKKSCCLRIRGPRVKVTCAQIITSDG